MTKQDTITTRVAGVSHKNNDGSSRQEYIAKLLINEDLILQRDKKNQYDQNAIMVLDSRGRQIGFIPRQLAAELAPAMDRGEETRAILQRITGGGPSWIYGCEISIYKSPPQENLCASKDSTSTNDEAASCSDDLFAAGGPVIESVSIIMKKLWNETIERTYADWLSQQSSLSDLESQLQKACKHATPKIGYEIQEVFFRHSSGVSNNSISSLQQNAGKSISESVSGSLTLALGTLVTVMIASICGGAGMALVAAGPLGLIAGGALGIMAMFKGEQWIKDNIKQLKLSPEVKKLFKSFTDSTLAKEKCNFESNLKLELKRLNQSILDGSNSGEGLVSKTHEALRSGSVAHVIVKQGHEYSNFKGTIFGKSGNWRDVRLLLDPSGREVDIETFIHLRDLVQKEPYCEASQNLSNLSETKPEAVTNVVNEHKTEPLENQSRITASESKESSMVSLIGGIKEASVTFTSRSQGIEYNNIEIAFGILSYVSWMIVSQSYQDDSFFTNANHTARTTALAYVREELSNKKMVDQINSSIGYGFSPNYEIELGAERIGPSDSRWSDWKNSLTRKIIMITRALAYKTAGIDTPGLSSFIPNNTSLSELVRAAKKELGEVIGRNYVALLPPNF